jgi:hypothetical protein
MRKVGRCIGLSILSFLFFNASIFAQQPQYTIPSNSSFRRLILSKEDIGHINFSPYRDIKFLPIKDTPFHNYGQDLIKSKKDLFIYLNASGIVYKFKKLNPNKDSLTFVRIDSTEHFGYNIDCFPFVYKNSLYNLGGYGFWRWNGHLRVFSELLKQWDIAKVNKEVPVIRFGRPSIWLDANEGEIITLRHLEGNDAEKDIDGIGVQQVDSVMILDLEKRDWKAIGYLDPNFAKNFNLSTLISNTKMGLFVNNNGNIELWNIKENKVYKYTDAHYTQILNAVNPYNFIWSEDSTIFLGKNNVVGIDSIVLSTKNLVATNKKIYIEQSNSGFYAKGITTAFVAMGLGGLLFYGFRKRKNTTSSAKKNTIEQPLQTSYPNQHIYSGIELDLISLLISNCKIHNRYTSVDELNHLLGMTNKSIEMQKRKRSDTIRSINEKFALVSKKEDAILIKRKKAEADGRLNEFYISEEDFDQFQG